MSPQSDRPTRRPMTRAAAQAAERAHEKARVLASDAIAFQLPPAEAAWLEKHLSRCAACRAVAGDYRAIHAELRGLAMPEPPRDLWARTSAAMDAVDRRRAARSARTGLAGLMEGRFGELARSRSALGSMMAAVAVVLVVGLAMFNQGSIFTSHAAPSQATAVAIASSSPTGGAQSNLAVVDGTSYWVAPENGMYQIKGGAANCTGTPESCAVTNGNGTVVGSIQSKTAVSVVISPNATQAAVWNANKIVILPLAQSAPATVAIDLLTPRPTAPAATTAAATAAPVTAPPAATAAATNDVNQPSPSMESGPTAGPTEQSGATPAAATSAPTPAPTPSGPQPTAILDGYKIVGRAPEFSANGLFVAFSARPVSANSGSDVFVWRVGWERARAVSTNHVDLFAGWLGSRILISEFIRPDAGATTMTAVSYTYDPMSTAVRRIDRPMLMPVVDPTGRYVIYWSGNVRFDAATGLWTPDRGDFYFDAWSNLRLVAAQFGASSSPTPEPTALPAVTEAPAAQPTEGTPAPATDPATSPTQAGQPSSPPSEPAELPQRVPVASGPGTVTGWSVRWDSTGQYVAVWVADGGASDVGHVTLLNVIPGTNTLNVGGLLLSAASQSNIQFDASQFVYTSPVKGGDGKTYLFQLPGTPPGPSATPMITAAPTSPSPSPLATEPAPAPTDSPIG